MEKDLNHQGRQGEDRGDGIRRRPKEERQQTARRRPVIDEFIAFVRKGAEIIECFA